MTDATPADSRGKKDTSPIRTALAAAPERRQPSGLDSTPADNVEILNASESPDWLILEDGPLIAVNKPAGLLTEGTPGRHATMVGQVKDWLRQKYDKAGNVYLGIPHRLDRASTGVLVFTRNSKTAARVAEQFEKREVTKIYWALLESVPEQSSGTLVDWLKKIPDEARTEIVDPNSPSAKEARLNYRVLSESAGACLVEIELLTGRMHQIRAQFASRGCPVVGDDKYGAAPWQIDEAPATEASDIRIALHARSLSLKHPIRYDALTIEAPLPDHWPIQQFEPGDGDHETHE